jgi:hypothetical protein
MKEWKKKKGGKDGNKNKKIQERRMEERYAKSTK